MVVGVTGINLQKKMTTFVVILCAAPGQRQYSRGRGDHAVTLLRWQEGARPPQEFFFRNILLSDLDESQESIFCCKKNMVPQRFGIPRIGKVL